MMNPVTQYTDILYFQHVIQFDDIHITFIYTHEKTATFQ